MNRLTLTRASFKRGVGLLEVACQACIGEGGQHGVKGDIENSMRVTGFKGQEDLIN